MFVRDKYGFWRQVDKKKKIEYNLDYIANKTHCTEAMVALRIGWVLMHLPRFENIRQLRCVDIGAGSGIFVRGAREVFGSCVGYDVVPETTEITTQELRSSNWDIAFSYDSLEHYDDVDDLFLVDARYHVVSYPETPQVARWEELRNWRHFRPGEHLWMLDKCGIYGAFSAHGYDVIACDNVEDAIRTPWSADKPNITTVMAVKR